MTRRKFSLGAITAPLLALVGCGATTVIAILQLAVDAAEAAIPIVANYLNISSATGAILLTYLQQVSTAVNGAATILANGGTVASQAAQLLALFANIAAPDLTGLPATIVAAIQLVAKYVAQFLAQIPQPATAAAKKPYALKPADRAKLLGIEAKAMSNIAAIAKLRH